jgi:hypothetical protein
MKYKNKDGISLSLEGHQNDSTTKLIKEVVMEVLEVGDDKGWSKAKEMLIENFTPEE